MSEKWKFEDIDWSLFDPGKVNPETLRVIKAGSVVEHNGSDYGLYLKNVFKGDDLLRKKLRSGQKMKLNMERFLPSGLRWLILPLTLKNVSPPM